MNYAIEVAGTMLASTADLWEARCVARAVSHRYGLRTVVRDTQGRVVCAYEQTGPGVVRAREVAS